MNIQERRAELDALSQAYTTLAHQYQAVSEQHEAAVKALQAWEKWEGDIIMDPDCWRREDCLPTITQELWDRVTEELQPLRNAALHPEQPSEMGVPLGAVGMLGRGEDADV